MILRLTSGIRPILLETNGDQVFDTTDGNQGAFSQDLQFSLVGERSS